MSQQDDRRQDCLQDNQGEEILREAAQLLNQLSFWPNRGAYAEGRYVAISVDPRWEGDNQTIKVVLTCYAFGHGQADWRALPVLARPLLESGPYGMARLNERGQGIMTHLQPDDYRLFVPERYTRSEAPLPFGFSHDHGDLAAATENDNESFEPQIYESRDNRVIATVRRLHDGATVVAFETWEANLSGATVYFAFVLPSGDILQDAMVALKPVEEQPGLLEARWEAEVEFTERCTFEFGVLPEDP
jgi:hypothetical protein